MEASTHAQFPIVGIGASAGGIEALQHFFRALPRDSGMAFVIVTHLNPERESVLHEIVARYTDMSVEPARDGVELRPNQVFVLPENAIIGVDNGRLRLQKLNADKRERKPVDIFLTALAKDQAENAVGIILSGGDGDGSVGIRAIKERGGLTMAQVLDGGGPRHPDMPNSAIATGMVDFAIPVDQMPEKLLQFCREIAALNVLIGREDSARNGETQRALQGIYQLLRDRVGHDFSGYKVNTFGRRVQRRMLRTQADTIEAYVEHLLRDNSEVAALFRDLLINVTGFFRDADAFEALATEVIPKLFERQAAGTVRVWVAGCATGEEVYSLAMLMREHMDGLEAAPKVQVFATDIDERSLATARAARFPEPNLEGVSPERRKRFFVPDAGAYVVAKEVRDLCVFSPHSVIRDPPFSRMDLVSCRNLLIYFGTDVQNHVIPIFHYALRSGGYLFIGQSENVGQFGDLFTPVDKQNRIFLARENTHAAIRVPLYLSASKQVLPFDPMQHRKLSSLVSLRSSVEAQVLERFAPPHVVVNVEGDIVFYSLRTGKYLEAAAGAPSRQLLGMVRKGLSLELRGALRDAIERRLDITRASITVEQENDRVQMVNVTVSPLRERDGEPLFIVLFEDDGPTLSRKDAMNRSLGDQSDAVGHLEAELRDARDRLQSMVEEYETALEELKSSNEELLSVNEELQSTNEELEASKEELQSINEELQTVNLELGHKVGALDQSNADLRNLFLSTQVATVFLDHDLIIRNFTPPAEALFNLVPSDRGRLLTSFSTKLAYPQLYEDIRATLTAKEPFERAVTSLDGRSFFLARLHPYETMELGQGEAPGIVLTFVDITSLTEAEARKAELTEELNGRMKN